VRPLAEPLAWAHDTQEAWDIGGFRLGEAPGERSEKKGCKPTPPEEESMSWTTPKVIEISVGMEINSYACADL
jgi:coenzyme PQQ precursor peptide PqqA